jgi:hypothetical protein
MGEKCGRAWKSEVKLNLPNLHTVLRINRNEPNKNWKVERKHKYENWQETNEKKRFSVKTVYAFFKYMVSAR